MDRTRDHELGDILVIALCALLCGGEHFTDMEQFGLDKEEWLRTFLRLPRARAQVFPGLFFTLDAGRAAGHPRGDEEIVALDGKALRRALKAKAVPYIVSAWAAENGLVLGQVKVDEKSNEITAVPELLRALELAGCIVTLDAMGCQKKIAREIREADVDYVLALKGNQETVHEEVKAFLDDAVEHDPKALAYYETTEKDHGRIEVRRYFLSSLAVQPKRFARAVRGHWSIENNLHWVLDVQFGEDQCRARTGYADQNLAALRRLALNLLKRETSVKCGIKTRQKSAGWNPAYLRRLLGLSVTLDEPQRPGEPSGA